MMIKNIYYHFKNFQRRIDRINHLYLSLFVVIVFTSFALVSYNATLERKFFRIIIYGQGLSDYLINRVKFDKSDLR